MTGMEQQGHSEACRRRLEEALKGSEKIKAAPQKADCCLEKALEKDELNRKRRVEEEQAKKRRMAEEGVEGEEERKRHRRKVEEKKGAKRNNPRRARLCVCPIAIDGE